MSEKMKWLFLGVLALVVALFDLWMFVTTGSRAERPKRPLFRKTVVVFRSPDVERDSAPDFCPSPDDEAENFRRNFDNHTE